MLHRDKADRQLECCTLVIFNYSCYFSTVHSHPLQNRSGKFNCLSKELDWDWKMFRAGCQKWSKEWASSLQEIISTVLLTGKEVTEERGRQPLSAGAIWNRRGFSLPLPVQAWGKPVGKKFQGKTQGDSSKVYGLPCHRNWRVIKVFMHFILIREISEGLVNTNTAHMVQAVAALQVVTGWQDVLGSISTGISLLRHFSRYLLLVIVRRA